MTRARLPLDNIDMRTVAAYERRGSGADASVARVPDAAPPLRSVDTDNSPHRRVTVSWSRRGVALEIFKVYSDSGVERLLVSCWLPPAQAQQLARNLRGKA